MDDFTPFQKCMIAVYKQNIDDILSSLDDSTLDYDQNDSQLLRELWCGRLTGTDTLRVYKKLVEKHNYILTTKDLDKLIHHQTINM